MSCCVLQLFDLIMSTSDNLILKRNHSSDRHLILIKGSIPGPKGGLVFVRTAVKEA